MREFIHLFLTNRRWFVGTMLVLFILFFFLWRLFDPQGFASAINSFFQAVWAIFQSLFVLAIVILVIRVMLGHRPWWMSGGSKKK